MIHVGESGRIHGSGASLVDFNRGGTPLVEIVTEPDLRGAAEAAEWARLLRETVRQLGVSDVNMEEGSLRVDANVSVRPAGSEELGTKTELKNMNSFRFLAARGRSRAGPPARADRGGGDGRAGDAALRPGERQPHLAALEGGGPRLPLLPRARPGAAGADRGDAARGARGAAGAAGRRGSSATRRWACADDVADDAGDRPGDGRLLRARRRGGRRASRRRWSATGSPASWRRRCARPRTRRRRRLQGLARRPSRRWSALVQEKKISHGSGKTVLAELVAEGGEPGRDRRARGPRPDVRLRRAGGDRRRRRSRPTTPTPPSKIREGNDKAIGAIVGAVMRETKGRADGGEVNRLIQEKLGSCVAHSLRSYRTL